MVHSVSLLPQSHRVAKALISKAAFPSLIAAVARRFNSIATVHFVENMQAANRLQKGIRAETGRSFGAWQMLPGSNLSRIIAKSGFDWVCVDTEHGNIDDGEMHEAVAAIADSGASPVVRIAANEGWMVKRALDAGAHGIVVPLLNTAEDAVRLVSSAKFPPQGTRGFGSPFAMRRFGTSSMTEYLQSANKSTVIIAQIETEAALANVDSIAKTDGIDILLVGPFDLGNSIGHPILDGKMSQELLDAIETIRQAANKNGKRGGIYATTASQARDYADQGFHFIAVITDATAIAEHFAAALGQAKGSYVHSAVNAAKGAVSGASKLTGFSNK